MIGNSRYHWAYFQGKDLHHTWHNQSLNLDNDWQNLPIYIASVVPEMIKSLNYPNQYIIQLEDISLGGKYSTLGIDRALAVTGAIATYSYPCLVIDCGTALTLTGVNQKKELIGGAILPGIGLQLKSLAMNTANLPQITLTKELPQLWGKNTSEAIKSGIIYTITAGMSQFLAQWWLEFPETPVIITGGDRHLLQEYLLQSQPEISHRLKVDGNLIFWGISQLVFRQN